MRRWMTMLAMAIGVGAALDLATPAPAAEPRQTAPTPSVSELVVTATRMVSELTVTAKCRTPERVAERAERPRGVQSFPERGAVVRPGLLVVRVTFDRPMACDGLFAPAPPMPNPCPGKVRSMLLSYDQRTVRTVCWVAPGLRYGFSLGNPGTNTFIGLSGLPVLPARISFSTSQGPPISDVCEALAEDSTTATAMREAGKSCEKAAP